MLHASQLIRCAGDPAAMGEAQGRAAAGALQAVFQAFLEGPELERTRPRWLPRGVHRRIAWQRAARLMHPELLRDAPEQLARMEGIARGSGVPLAWLHLGLAAELLLNQVAWVPGEDAEELGAACERGGVGREARVAGLGACSALGVGGARSRVGGAIVKTFDYPEAFRVGFCARESRPARGLASLDVTVAALAGCHSGVNEAGLALTYNYGYGQDRGASRVPITLLAQRTLESCRSVAEAERYLRAAPRAGGGILTLADAEGEVLVLELSPTRTAARRGEVLAATNHYLDPSLAAVDVPSHARFGPDALPWLRGLEVHASSRARLGHLERLAAATRSFGLAELEAVARDHGPEDFGTDHTLCRHGDYYRSTCAVVLLPRERALRVLFGQPCEQYFVEHRLGAPARARRPLPLAG